jgi:putative aldouronate transport system permease protein
LRGSAGSPAADLIVIRSPLGKRIRKGIPIYILVLPTFVWFLVFHYAPFFGITIAFKDFKIFQGIAASPWVGFEHFRNIFNAPNFYRVLWNTVKISFLRLVIGFPVPIIFSLFLNEVRHSFYKRFVQTVTFFPHFLSWIVYGGIMMSFIKPTGVINSFLKSAGLAKINFLTDGTIFTFVLVITAIMKEFGFSAIIYLAALSAIDSALYEAATVDGAGKMRLVWHITLPGIRPTVITLLILALGNILNAGFEQIFLMYNASVYHAVDIIDTYVYRLGIANAQYSIGTAMGLFKGVIASVLIYLANRMAHRMGTYGIW